jgi:hypothetical protein
MDDNDYTVTIDNGQTVTISTDSSDIWSLNNNISTSIDTINISDYTTSSADDITFDFNNISISPTLWTETLPDVDTVNDMCEQYPALAKAYENFQTVYKLVEQDYKGKKEDNT